MTDDNSKKQRLETLKSLDSSSKVSVVELESSIKDVHAQEKKFSANNRESRDDVTTELYNKYRDRFQEHNDFKKGYKVKLYSLCKNILTALSIGIIACILAVIIKDDLKLGEIIAIIIPSCVTYVSSIISILTIIAKHLFPLDEEQYVNDIVKTIIETDLKSKEIDRKDEDKESK